MKPVDPLRALARVAALALSLAAGSLAVPTALAHEVPLPADEMVRSARFVVVARVASARAEWNDRRNLILTRYALDVEEGLRGRPPARLDITVVGGTLDGETQQTCLTVPLDVGARYLLFLDDPATPTFGTFTGAHAGVFREVAAADGGEPEVASAGGTFVTTGSDQRVPFREFVDRMRAFIAATDRTLGPPPRQPVVHDPPLPKKVFDASDAYLPEWRVNVPAAPVQSAGPGEPAAPVIEMRDPSYARLVPPRPDQGTDYSYSRAPARYIVWNELPPSFAPWSPHDQYMMSRWNAYGDIHRVSGAPTGNWQWGNNRYDMTGWPSNQDMINQFGAGWGANTLAICYTRWFGDGPIVEADISMNPAFGWTLDTDTATRWTLDNNTWGYPDTVLHELGHSWGLAHPWEVQDVWWDSVMNYAPKEFRFPVLWADDTNAIRAAYPGINVHDGAISMWTTGDMTGNNNAAYYETYPNWGSVQQMSAFPLNQAFKVENVGTDNIVNPRVDVYLTPFRLNWSGYVYLQSLYYTLTMAPFQTWYLDAGSIYVPYNTPPGKYWVALWLPDAYDPYTYNNEAWTTNHYGQIRVTSYPWSIYMAPYWQGQQVSTGPDGSYDFYFYATAGERYDISTCPADAGGAGFDTILEVWSPSYQQAGWSDDYCGLQSRISFEAAETGQYHIVLKGYGGAYGWVTMSYRTRSFSNGYLQMAIPVRNAWGNTVDLSWYGDAGPYDLERATSPDFADAVRLLNGSSSTAYSDYVLSDGVTYFYRAR